MVFGGNLENGRKSGAEGIDARPDAFGNLFSTRIKVKEKSLALNYRNTFSITLSKQDWFFFSKSKWWDYVFGQESDKEERPFFEKTKY
jgi:hypothetical protein